MNTQEITIQSAVDLMEFIDIFGMSPEQVPSGKNIDDLIDFLIAVEFKEYRITSHWKTYIKKRRRIFS